MKKWGLFIPHAHCKKEPFNLVGAMCP